MSKAAAIDIEERDRILVIEVSVTAMRIAMAGAPIKLLEWEAAQPISQPASADSRST